MTWWEQAMMLFGLTLIWMSLLMPVQDDVERAVTRLVAGLRVPAEACAGIACIAPAGGGLLGDAKDMASP